MENKIKQLRIEQGLSQKQLAKLSNLSLSYICHLENGSRKNPTFKAMVNIAKALNKDVNDLFKIE